MKERFTLAKIDFPWAPRVSDTVSTLGFSWKCQLLKASFSGKSYHETGASPTNQRVSKHDTSWKEPDPKLSKSCGILVRSERILQSKHSSRSTSAMRHTPGPSYGKSLPGAFHAAAARLRVVVWWCQVAPPTMLVTNGRRAFFLISAFKKWIMFMSTIFLDSVRLSRSFRPAQVLQIQINAGIIYPIGSINTKRADINKHHNCKFIKWGLIHPGFFLLPITVFKAAAFKGCLHHLGDQSSCNWRPWRFPVAVSIFHIEIPSAIKHGNGKFLEYMALIAIVPNIYIYVYR